MKEKITKIVGAITEFWYVSKEIIGVIGMVLMIIILFAVGCQQSIREQKATLYYNEKVIIVGSSASCGVTDIKTWLIQRVTDTTQFAELSSVLCNEDYHITLEQWYNKNIGDTLYFDYIRKNRFFKIIK